MSDMNRFRYPVIQVTPADRVEVASHITLASALGDAALRDAAGEPLVWHYVDEGECHREHARTH